MLGLMQDWRLTLDKILSYAAREHPDTAVIDRSVTQSQVCDYRSLEREARRFTKALLRHNVVAGDRVATLLWNDTAHLAAWYGTMGMGAVLHTLNPRLHVDQIGWIANHAKDRMLVADARFLDIVEVIVAAAPGIETIVLVGGGAGLLKCGRPAISFDAFLASGDEGAPQWGEFSEESAAGLCYTSGTTGDPKGVLYSHRSNFLHAFAANQPNAFGIREGETVLPIVPMFHANAWGLTFMAPMAGASLVLPGSRLDGPSLAGAINEQGVTIAAGVPTVCMGLLDHLRATGSRPECLKRLIIGGAAVTPDLVEGFERDLGVEVIHAWGMTELSPVGCISKKPVNENRRLVDLGRAARLRQGSPIFPLETRIQDETGAPVPHDDRTPGHLAVKGPFVTKTYFAGTSEVIDAEGFFDTGDIAVRDQHGSIRIVDRAKDIIKSGGEWISALEIETLASALPGVAAAAVIGVPDVKWGERPMLVVEPKADAILEAEAILAGLDGQIPKWWMPERIEFRTIPLGATGKIDKKTLRTMMAAEG
ncbi:long-chain-fatty-acid--CoA ligase [Novosphingobium kaempferiae]|uniref:long-chain-fatty-acid--CoA ligase n=1 Tax=Novosphingobium kaempferiae TaxID=2896849 RepID=UPI001E52AE73|nr:long-chain-fatty-acid--CoA ligase [Novosphingobium kaempferiae]